MVTGAWARWRRALGGPPEEPGAAPEPFRAQGGAVHLRDFPDPFVLATAGGYTAYATNGGGENVPAMVSGDLAHWEPVGDVLPRLPAWAQAGFTWAPAVLPRAGHHVLYYTVREPRSGRQCISAAAGPGPAGPFRDDRAEPLVFQRLLGGSIDPSPFVDDDGTAWLLWKSDDNALGRPSRLWARPLAPDGLAFTGEPAELLRHDQRWERPLIEAPAMVRHDGRCYLFYSANWWESARYGVGYAVGPGPTGPFTKVTTAGPWFAGGDGAAGPGGQELFTDGQGRLRMAFHGWSPDRVGYAQGGARRLHVACVDFDAQGRPVVSG
ncbi:MAG: glycoside hydrolase family 43 protein [Actinomycetota bacterium]